MADFRDTIREYQPTKTVWFWSCIGSAVATIVVGFAWGGWVMGGTAQEMAQESANEARASLAATVCVNRFMSAPDARTNLAALMEESSFSRDDYVEDGGWVTFGDSEDPIDGAGDLCADQLAEVELPPADEPGMVEAGTVDESVDAQDMPDESSEPS